MGGCINRGNDIITMRINDQQKDYYKQSNIGNNKHKSMPSPVLDLNFKKVENGKTTKSLPKLYTNNISKILNFNENDINNSNSLREILEII